jgi:hypothetical protein
MKEEGGRMKPILPIRRLQRWVALTWTAWLLSLGLLWWQHLTNVLHPPAFLFVGLLAFTVIAALVAVVNGLWRLLRGPSRGRAVAWLVAGLVPVAGWTALALKTQRNWQKRYVPHDIPTILMMRTAHSLMEAEAAVFYVRRLESQRLVMFYGDSVTDPDGDLRAMDQHVAEMERTTGLPLRAKIHWVRGRVLGRGMMCCCGFAAGSDHSPADALDRHELAHAVLHQHYGADTDPPTLLSEGWAESQSLDHTTLAERALGTRQLLGNLAQAPPQERESWIRSLVDAEGFRRLLSKARESKQVSGPHLAELTDSFWYHHDNGPVYSVGGAFTSFLLRQYGPARFFECYFTCRPETIERDCLRIFGANLNTLDKQFWEDALQLVAGNQAPDQAKPSTP